MESMTRLSSEKRQDPDIDEFRHIVATAILARRAERFYGELDLQGYRAR